MSVTKLFYLLIFVLIWATSLDEHFAFLVARHCTFHCDCCYSVHYFAQLGWLNELIDW